MHEYNYDLYEELTSLSTLLDDYQAWFSAVSLCTCFPGAAGAVPAIPYIFIESLRAIPQNEISHNLRGELADLERRHHDLHDTATALCSAAASGKVADSRQFSEFSTRFRAFIKGLQHACQGLILEEWGLDVLTGLKNRRAMMTELAQEMERLARHGHAFSLALVRINDFSEILNAIGHKEGDLILKQAATFIRKSLRSFDDAYNIGGGEFILSLKQAGLSGGQRALERLRGELEQTDFRISMNNAKFNITMACCVAEPLPDDDLQHLITNMRDDLLLHNKRDEGAVLTYVELSPLQMFVKTETKE